jgi:hypothetical protein
MVRVLIDHSVRRDAQVGQWTTERHSVKWGGHVVSSDVAVLGRRPMPDSSQVDRIANIQALPMIRKLALDGVVELAVSRELKYEGWTGRNPSVGTKGDLLAGVPIETVSSPIERTFFRQTADLSQFLDRDYFRDYCDFLNRLSSQQAERCIELLPDLPESSIRGLRDIRTFQKLCAGAAIEHYPDLFHWWTAEHAGCSHFLTMERRFKNVANNQCRGVVNCKVSWPTELLAELQITELEPMPMEEGEVMSFFDAMITTDANGPQ